MSLGSNSYQEQNVIMIKVVDWNIKTSYKENGKSLCKERVGIYFAKYIIGELCNWYWKREGWRERCYWTAGLKYTATAFVFSIFPYVAASENLMTLAMKSWMT